jgi:outer membrane cobalamin receptor
MLKGAFMNCSEKKNYLSFVMSFSFSGISGIPIFLIFTTFILFSIFVVPCPVMCADSAIGEAAGMDITGEIYELPGIAIEGYYTEKEAYDPVAVPLKSSPSIELSTRVIDKEKIEDMGAKVITDTVVFTPNIRISEQGRKYKKQINIRNQTPGVVSNGASIGNDQRSLYSMPVDTVEKIEIIMDSSALIYGKPSIGGFINIINNPFTRDTVIKAEQGTFDTFNSMIRHSFGGYDWDFALGYTTLSTNGPDDLNAAEDYGKIDLNFRKLFVNDSYLKFNFSNQNGFRQIANQVKPDSSDWIAADHKSFDNKFKNMNGWGYDPWKVRALNLEVHRNWSKRKSTNFNIFQADQNSGFYTKLNGNTVDIKDRTIGFSLRHTLVSPDRDFTLRSGIQYEYWNSPTGKLYYVNKGEGSQKKYYGAFVQADKDLGHNVTIDGGVRWDRTHILHESETWSSNKINISDQWEDPVLSYALGVTKKFNYSFSSSLRYGTGTRDPRNKFATQDGSILEAEDQQQINLGMNYLFDNDFELQINIFKTNQDNALADDGDKLISAPGTPDEYMSCFKNTDIESNGFEVSLKKMLSPFFSFDLGYGFTEYKSSLNPAAEKEFPEYNYNFGLHYKTENTRISFLGKHVSSYEGTRFMPAGKPAHLGDYTSCNFSVYHDFRKNEKVTRTIHITVENLFDEKFSTIPTYTDYGRRVLAGCTWRFR